MNEPADIGENKLFGVMLKCGTAAFCVLVVSIAGCSMHADYRLSQTVIESKDPIAVACALKHDAGICAIAAMKRAAQ